MNDSTSNSGSVNNDNPPSGAQTTAASGSDRSKMAPGDEAPPGTSGTGEDLCRGCGGSGKMDDGKECKECAGTGKVTVAIGGA